MPFSSRRTARSRPPATTTSSSSTRRSPAGSRSGTWAEPEREDDRLLRPLRDRRRAGLARSTPIDGLRRRRARAHVRRWPDGNPRSRLVRARVHGLRSRRHRPQAREQEAGRAATRAEHRDRHRAHRRAAGRRGLALRARRVVVRGVLAKRGSRSRPRRSSADDDRVFASDRFSDWMLFKIPELRGRMAYDVRFELYDARLLRRPPGLQLRGRPRLEVVRRRIPDRDRRRDGAVRTPTTFSRSRAPACSTRDDELTVIARPRA